jgi:hypothetical protein
MRWEFEHDGGIARAVRAVDTATHPDYQGRGIFKLLTLRALDELADEGVAFVFNTPNDQSRPGYLKMGWELVDRLPVLARPRTPLSLLRLATARVPADKWSQPTAAGEPAGDALADREAVAKLLASQPGWDGLRTNRTPAHLAWRYGFGALSYRAVVSAHGIDDGFVVFRLRRRGGAVEAALVDALVPGGDAAHARALWTRALRESRADYGARLAGDGYGRGRYLPVPNQGPTFVWRAVNETAMAPAAEWRLGLGDIELF